MAKKRMITQEDVGKVFRVHCPHQWTSFWVSDVNPTSMSDGDFLLVHFIKRFGPTVRKPYFYLYMPRRKKKWVLGTIADCGVGWWFEELTPLEVLILCGTGLPRKYKRKQFTVK